MVMMMDASPLTFRRRKPIRLPFIVKMFEYRLKSCHYSLPWIVKLTTLAAKRYGRHLQTNDMADTCNTNDMADTLAAKRYGRHLQTNDMADTCKTNDMADTCRQTIWQTLADKRYGRHLQTNDMADTCRQTI
ncbi:Hypothetical predicted protein [Mytilus galloprovincialis]|uniref:Uncharacterized protein n=1 Tax=Mytilus galloprovincialis TaxID=29158 RepID=A0A8B6BXT7_MYTGA|nr:Hypothetical predicted protein [Mytilus galloprovincialis]